MSRDFIVWEPILKGWSGYYVEYCPARTDNPQAFMNVVFTSPMPIGKVAEILEKEFVEWSRMYSVPLFAAALDEKEDTIRLSSIRSGDYIHGYYDPVADKLALHWEATGEPIPEHLTQPDHLKAVYSALAIKTTGEQCQKEVDAYVMQMRALKKFLYTWSFIRLFIWPPIKKFVYEVSLIGTFARLRAYGKSVREWQMLTGQIKPSQKEIEESERKRIEAHWLHHCRKNPDGFVRIRTENFEQEAKERVRKEAADAGVVYENQ